MATVTTGAAPAVETKPATSAAVIPAAPPLTPATIKRYQPSLFDTDSFIDRQLSKVLVQHETKDKEGDPNGITIVLGKRKEIAKAVGLTTKKDDKDALDNAILEGTDAAFTKVKGIMAGLDRNWTLRRAALKTMSNGEEQFTIVARKVKRNNGPSDEQIAKAWGIPVEKVAEMREKQQAAIKPVVNI